MIGKRIDTHLVILFDFSSVKFFSARVQKTTSTHNNQRLQKRNQSLKHKKMRLAFKSPLHSWLSWSVLCFHKGILFFPFFIIVVYIFILYTRFLTLLYLNTLPSSCLHKSSFTANVYCYNLFQPNSLYATICGF